MPGEVATSARNSIYPHPWVDLREKPILRTIFPDVASEADIYSYLSVIVQLQTQMQSEHCWILDCSLVKAAPASQRKIFAQYERENASYNRRFNKGSAFIIPNTLVRGLLTAIYWLSPPVYPYTIVNSEAEAKRWVQEQLKKR